MSSESEEEVVRTTKYKTRSGRISNPTCKTQIAIMPTDGIGQTSATIGQATATTSQTSTTVPTVGMDNSNNPVLISPEELRKLLNSNSNTTLISGDSLPVFRGRKRPCDPPFEESNTFAQHIAMLKSYFSSLTNCNEADKKQLLVRSANSKMGDFHVIVSDLVSGHMFNDSTFDEIVEVLDNMYSNKVSKNIQSISREVRKHEFVEDNNSLPSQISPLAKRLTVICKHYIDDDKIKLREELNKSVTRLPGESESDFIKKQENFLSNLMCNAMLFITLGAQLNDENNKKILGGKFKSLEEIVTQYSKVMRDLPLDKTALYKSSAAKDNTQKNVTDTLVAEQSNNFEEVYYSKSGQFNRGRGRNFRSFRSRGHTNWNRSGNGRGVSVNNNYVDKTETNHYGKYKCYECGHFGHIAKYCKTKIRRCMRCGTKSHNTYECDANFDAVRRQKASQEVRFADTGNFLE